MGNVIGVVHVPAIDLLCVSQEWRRAFGFPEPTKADWNGIVSLRGSSHLVAGGMSSMLNAPDALEPLISDRSRCFKVARSLSFMDFLHGRVLSEARAYADAGISHLLLDFHTHDYAEEPAEYWIAYLVAESLVNACKGEFTVGVRMNNDLWACGIACSVGCGFVFCSDSHDFCMVSSLRNRLTDGTGRLRPRLYRCVYDFHDFDEMLSLHVEGVEFVGVDEDRLDELGSALARIEGMTHVHVPVACQYSDEVSRGELHFPFEKWGTRDFIIVDSQARKDELRGNGIDTARLSEICGRISGLK